MLSPEQHKILVHLIQTMPPDVSRELQFAAAEGKPWETFMRIVQDFNEGRPVDSWDRGRRGACDLWRGRHFRRPCRGN